MDALVEAIRDGATRRGLRLVEALFAAEPAVLLDLDQTPLDVALDIAAATSAPFLTLEVSHFDELEEMERFAQASPDAPIPTAIKVKIEGRAGQIKAANVRWMGWGRDYILIGIPSWATEIDDLFDSWEQLQDADEEQERETWRARISELVGTLEKRRELREAGLQQRHPVARKLVDALRVPTDEDALINHVVRRAVDVVRTNAQDRFADLEEQLADLASELRKQTIGSGLHVPSIG
ncbi:hypothetical protein [Rathayibacter sp. AY1E1]|uniref:hypothetical protein n=1 Tax=Rathayibacter sp. AY1E1 TaxID=2080549 RepID=UPI0011B0AA43|nr:hypothetical protein [Rathayibacter sp. AY1E1]